MEVEAAGGEVGIGDGEGVGGGAVGGGRSLLKDDCGGERAREGERGLHVFLWVLGGGCVLIKFGEQNILLIYPSVVWSGMV